jgi:hypothetical protein
MTADALDDRAFLAAFRDASLPTDAFHHRDHVRMAWLYVRDHGHAEAAARFAHDLQCFARAKSVPGLYHATITGAYIALIAERMLGSAHVEAGRPRSLLLGGAPVVAGGPGPVPHARPARTRGRLTAGSLRRAGLVRVCRHPRANRHSRVTRLDYSRQAVRTFCVHREGIRS